MSSCVHKISKLACPSLAIGLAHFAIDFGVKTRGHVDMLLSITHHLAVGGATTPQPRLSLCVCRRGPCSGMRSGGTERREPPSAPSHTTIDLPHKTRQEVSSFQKGRDKKCASETTDYHPFAYENLQFVPIKLASPVLAVALGLRGTLR